MQKRRLFITGILLVLIGVLAGCSFGKREKQQEKKTADYYIGVVEDNAPYYYEAEDGTPKGYYVNLMNLLAKKYSFTYAFVPVDISAYEENLSDNRIDAFIGAVPDKSYKESSFFESETLYTSKVYALAASNANIHALKEAENKGIAAVADTEEEAFAKYLANKYDAQAVPFSSMKEALSDIENGQSQLLAVDAAYYKEHQENFKEWRCLNKSQRFQNNHKLLTKKNGKLQSVFEKGIAELKKSGELQGAFSLIKK